jgi:hypothetical protein
MWRDRNRYDDHGLVPDLFWLVVAAVLFAACGLVWLIGQVAAILFGPHHAHLPVRLVDMLGVLLQLPGTWDDPARAWPPDVQPLLPGPVGMYAAAVLTFWIPALLFGLLVRLVSPRARRRRRQRGARWASLWQLRRLLVVGPRRGRIILGRRDRLRDRLVGRLYLAVEQCHSVLAVLLALAAASAAWVLMPRRYAMPGTEQLRKEWAAYAKLGRAHITPEHLTGLFIDQLIRRTDPSPLENLRDDAKTRASWMKWATWLALAGVMVLAGLTSALLVEGGA